MTLFDILHLISRDRLPLILDNESHSYDSIDIRPDSIYKVTICFMCEEETWVTTYPENAILVPWYDCKVVAISPGDQKNTLEIWLDYVNYLKDKFPESIYIANEE